MAYWHFGVKLRSAAILPGTDRRGCVEVHQEPQLTEDERHVVEFAAWVAEELGAGGDPWNPSRAEHEPAMRSWEGPWADTDALYGEAVSIVQRQWRAVERVAEALIERGRLEAEDLEALRTEVWAGDVCANCSRSMPEDTSVAEVGGWRYHSDGVGALLPFCPRCGSEEFGAPLDA